MNKIMKCSLRSCGGILTEIDKEIDGNFTVHHYKCDNCNRSATYFSDNRKIEYYVNIPIKEIIKC